MDKKQKEKEKEKQKKKTASFLNPMQKSKVGFLYKFKMT